MRIELRPAVPQDFEYCRRIYCSEMREMLEKLHLDPTAHARGFTYIWNEVCVRIIVVDGIDLGWIQTSVDDHGDMFIAQLFVEAQWQGRGIGTAVMQRLISEATRDGQSIWGYALKTNPAVQLYKRLGFRVVREGKDKFCMLRECTPSTS